MKHSELLEKLDKIDLMTCTVEEWEWYMDTAYWLAFGGFPGE